MATNPAAGAPLERPGFGDELEALRARLDAAKTYLRLPDLVQRLGELERIVAEPDLWSDPDNARKTTTAYGRTKDDIDLLEGLERQLVDAEELLAIGLGEGEAGLAEVTPDVEEAIASLRSSLEDVELRSLFSGEYDEGDAIAENPRRRRRYGRPRTGRR